MKIRSLHLKNIGVFEDETISFPEKASTGAVSTAAEIHILTGENGTGKTTILQALAYYLSKEVFDLRGEFDRISSFISFKKKFQGNSYGKIEINGKEFIRNKEKLYAFAYSGNRFIRHEENINIKENAAYNPLENALEFDKEYGNNDYSLNQWLANTISKRSFARDEGNEEKAKLFDKNIKFLEQIIQEIIEKPIKFEPVYETGIKIVANVNEKKLDFDLLPDGLRSIISWLGDLIMRMDAIKWENDLDIKDREFILFLDEIEVHLHPSWQRKILPVVQKLFKNAQIFITTHSPFIVNSVDGAWIHELDLDEFGNSKVTKTIKSDTSKSYQNIIREVFDIHGRFGESIETELRDFTNTRNDILLGKNVNYIDFLDKARNLAHKSEEIKNIVLFELRQLSNKTHKEFTL